MKEENRIEEFHCSNSSFQPLRKSSNVDDGALTSSSLTASQEGEELKINFNQKRGIFQRSNTVYTSSPAKSKSNVHITPSKTTKYRSFEQSTCLLYPLPVPKKTGIAKKDANIKESIKSKEKKKNYSDKEVLKYQTAKNFVLDSEKYPEKMSCFSQAMDDEVRLREELTESLSPSPFKKNDPGEQEEKLEQLVASQAPITKNILCSPFYDNDVKAGKGHNAWTKALKEHIVQTLESICIIKKLKPVPFDLIEKKKLPKEDEISST